MNWPPTAERDIPKYIEVTKCEDPSIWYSKLIKEVFPVDKDRTIENWRRNAGINHVEIVMKYIPESVREIHSNAIGFLVHVSNCRPANLIPKSMNIREVI